MGFAENPCEGDAGAVGTIANLPVEPFDLAARQDFYAVDVMISGGHEHVGLGAGDHFSNSLDPGRGELVFRRFPRESNVASYHDSVDPTELALDVAQILLELVAHVSIRIMDVIHPSLPKMNVGEMDEHQVRLIVATGHASGGFRVSQPVDRLFGPEGGRVEAIPIVRQWPLPHLRRPSAEPQEFYRHVGKGCLQSANHLGRAVNQRVKRTRMGGDSAEIGAPAPWREIGNSSCTSSCSNRPKKGGYVASTYKTPAPRKARITR